MATVVAYTSLNLTKEQNIALCSGVEHGVSRTFNIDIHHTELMIMPVIPPECHGPVAAGQITYFVYTAPDKTDEQKRQMVKTLYNETIKVTGPLGKGKVVVIIKEHANKNVAVDGILKSDI